MCHTKTSKKMVSFNLLTGGLTMCFAVSLYRCEVSEDSYNTLLTKLKGPKESGFPGTGKDHIHKSNPTKGYSCYKQDSPIEEIIDSHIHNDSGESMFATGFRDLRLIYEECQKKIRQRSRRRYDGSRVEDDLSTMKEKVMSLYKCMKVFSFRQLDDFLSDDVVPVSRYLEFVKDAGNETKPRTSRMRGHPYAAEILSKNWGDLLLERIGRLLQGHALKFRLGDDLTQGRGRRRDHRMFAMMMMGFVIMASILVPMGFQFLTVLGGKSLLMAKMALIMSAINGLKKIATSNVGYGLYHAGPEAFHHDPHHHHGFHDKIFHLKAPDQPESPFNVVI